MFCNKCGKNLDPNTRFCGGCGAPVMQPQQPMQQPAPAPVPAYQMSTSDMTYQPPVPTLAPAGLSWREFYDAYVSKRSKGNLTWLAVICFITAGVSIAAMAMFGGALYILDLLVYAAAGILLLTTKHWGCSLGITIYGGIGSLISLVTSGTPTGFVAIVLGVICTIMLKKAEKAYKEYLATGMAPQQDI